MNKLREFFEDLPRGVRIWSVTILSAIVYILIRYFQAGGQENFHLFDRVVAIYGFASLIVFIGFFMTSDPE